MRILPLVFLLFVVAGCSTHRAKLEYEGAGDSRAANPVFGQVVVSDERGTAPDWLGAIRGGYGNRLKTLRTEGPADAVVDRMYTDALTASGLMGSSDLPYYLQVKLTKFDCSYYFNREAYAHVNVSIIDGTNANSYFSKSYKSDETEGGVGAGIFGDVDTLRDLAETAMNNTIDKMLSDPEFHQATARLETEVTATTKSSDSDVRFHQQVKEMAIARGCTNFATLIESGVESEKWRLDCGDGEQLQLRCFDDACFVVE